MRLPPLGVIPAHAGTHLSGGRRLRGTEMDSRARGNDIVTLAAVVADIPELAPPCPCR
jgi:hypothetical protein